ncbi:MAG: hypothetical protein QM642_08025 [Edaphocola sp.]
MVLHDKTTKEDWIKSTNRGLGGWRNLKHDGYMTMIASMLLLIYKKANNIGYKTAKRRIAMELRDMITAILIIFAGGNPDKVFKT